MGVATFSGTCNPGELASLGMPLLGNLQYLACRCWGTCNAGHASVGIYTSDACMPSCLVFLNVATCLNNCKRVRSDPPQNQPHWIGISTQQCTAQPTIQNGTPTLVRLPPKLSRTGFFPLEHGADRLPRVVGEEWPNGGPGRRLVVFVARQSVILLSRASARRFRDPFSPLRSASPHCQFTHDKPFRVKSCPYWSSFRSPSLSSWLSSTTTIHWMLPLTTTVYNSFQVQLLVKQEKIYEACSFRATSDHRVWLLWSSQKIRFISVFWTWAPCTTPWKVGSQL